MLVDPLSDSRGLLDTTSPFFMAGPAHISVSMVMVFTSVFSLVFFYVDSVSATLTDNSWC